MTMAFKKPSMNLGIVLRAGSNGLSNRVFPPVCASAGSAIAQIATISA